MRRKYFMRGLGLGVIITALIFTISLTIGGGRSGMTDGEVIKRAKELGMVNAQNATMSDTKQETNGSDTQESTPDGDNNTDVTEGENETTTEPDGTVSEGASVTVEELTGSDVKPAPNLTTSPSAQNSNTIVTESAPGVSQTTGHTSSSENIVKFSVRSGENSAVVAANLYKAGLVTNPTDFDNFLEANGYDKNIRPGTYSIRSGSSDETIAKAITGN